jgi:very-short-patch-repair endonuclease
LILGGGARAGSPDPGRRRAGLDADEIALWYGVALTSVARTVVDLARADRGAGLAAADAALAERLTSRDALRAAAARCSGWPGNASARWVADHADPLAESPLESLTRACLMTGGLPRPQLQAVIRDELGFVGRVDLLWPVHRVIVEADGRVKYQQPRDVWNEKRRQDRLVRLGYRVERVTWADVVDHPHRTVGWVRDALEAASRSTSSFGCP